MIHGTFYCWDQAECSTAAGIRRTVLENELGWAPSRNEDGLDEFAMHAVVYDGDRVVGAGRVAYLDGKYVISHVCVLPDFRRKQYGDFLMRMMCDRVFCAGAQTVFCTLPVRYRGLGEKIGFAPCGDPLTQEGEEWIPLRLEVTHFQMQCGHAYCPGTLKK